MIDPKYNSSNRPLVNNQNNAITLLPILRLFRAMFIVYCMDSSCVGTKTIPGIGLLFTHKNRDFGAISVTERSCAVTISKVEGHLSGV